MINPELNLLIDKLFIIVNDADAVIKSQANEIYKMPKEERKPYLDEHYALKDYIDESWHLIALLAKELDKRPTIQQYEQTKQQLRAAREYIRILGGNPSLLTFSS